MFNQFGKCVLKVFQVLPKINLFLEQIKAQLRPVNLKNIPFNRSESE